MNLKLSPRALSGQLSAIASKSMAHRLLICAALSEKPSSVVCTETSADIDATAQCLTALGAAITFDSGVFQVTPIPRPVSGDRALDCGESGSTLRFMLPVACALGTKSSFLMSGRLPKRPLSPLSEELIAHGCALSRPQETILQTTGQLRCGHYTIPGNISSQYISGLLFALPLISGSSQITVLGETESQSYIDMTRHALSLFGIKVNCVGQIYHIEGPQEYKSSENVTIVEGDWSNAAFWLCAGAVGDQSITVSNLTSDSLQGDKGILDTLLRFGAEVHAVGNAVTVRPGILTGIHIDAANIPDLVPVLAAVASVAEGTTVIYNAQRLRIKESDRLKSVTETLTALGADIKETPDGLHIVGKPQLKGGIVSAQGDHRIAMMSAIIASKCQNDVTLLNAEAVNKSYPRFFDDFAALGGHAEEVL